MLRAHGVSHYLLNLAVFRDLRCGGPAPTGIPRFPVTEGMGKAAANRYRTLFAAYVILPQDILLRRHDQILYIGPHGREHLVGLAAECEEPLTRWILGIQSGLEAGDDALPPFSTAVAATPERLDRTLKSDHVHTGPSDQGGAARSTAKRRQIAGNGGASSCTYCGRTLEGSTGDSAVASLWAGHVFRVPRERKCMPAARRTARNAPRVGMPTRSHASRFALNGRQEPGLSIRRGRLRTFQGHGRGEGGRQ